MGEAVQLRADVLGARSAARRRLRRSIAALDRMVADGYFATEADTCGFEVELDLVDPLGRPRHANAPVLAALHRDDFQEELAQFNLEVNVEPRPIRGPVLARLADELTATLATADTVSQDLGARVVAVGILPTLSADDLTPAHLSSNPRYALLDERMAAMRRRPVEVDITGREHLQVETDSITVQGAATALQVHVRVSPADFPRFYNAAQAIAPAQVAVGANSPFLLGRSLWAETRIALIEQSLDVRPSRGPAADEPPRVWSGPGWVHSGLDVLAENATRFTPLIPMLDREDPLTIVEEGGVPSLHELRLHNGTIWRWNRPVYDVQHGHPHLRIENRVLPSGPTVTDMLANSAFYLGLLRAVADREPPVAEVWPFATVVDDLHTAARLGLDAPLHWPGARGVRPLTARRLLLDTLLPLAASGLDAWGVHGSDTDRFLGVLQARASAHRTGADWQRAVTAAIEERGADRQQALREMVRRYVEHAAAGEPVHRWPL